MVSRDDVVSTLYETRCITTGTIGYLGQAIIGKMIPL